MVEVEPSGHLLRGEHAASAPADIVDILYLDIYISGYLVLSSPHPAPRTPVLRPRPRLDGGRVGQRGRQDEGSLHRVEVGDGAAPVIMLLRVTSIM